MMKNLTSLIFGTPSKAKKGKTVVVGRIDGCMAEQFTPIYEGKIKAKTKGTVPMISIKVSKSYTGQHPINSLQTEIQERLRTLSDGTLIIAN